MYLFQANNSLQFLQKMEFYSLNAPDYNTVIAFASNSTGLHITTEAIPLKAPFPVSSFSFLFLLAVFSVRIAKCRLISVGPFHFFQL